MAKLESANGRERNRRGDGSRLREEIIEAGISLIDQRNDPTALTLRGIARAAGISAPSIYPHFADVAEVTAAVLDRSFDELRDDIRSALAKEVDPEAGLLAACRTYVQFGWDHRARYRLMFAANGFAPNAVDTFAIVEASIARCVAAGVSSSVDPHADTFLVWVALHGIATLEKPNRTDYQQLGPLDRPAFVLTLVRRLAGLRGLNQPERAEPDSNGRRG